MFKTLSLSLTHTHTQTKEPLCLKLTKIQVLECHLDRHMNQDFASRMQNAPFPDAS
jgi:hypothetical protein